MKGFKILALTAAMAAASSAFALEAVDEDTLSATTGQVGLTIALDNGTSAAPGITVDHLRWRDNDGFGATYTGAGMVDLANLQLWGQTTVALDVGTDTTTGQTGLNVGLTMNGVGFNFGQISLVDGGSYGLTQTAGVAYQSFGTLSISNLTLPNMNLLITAGGQSGDGITIQTSNVASLGLSIDFADRTSATTAGHIMADILVTNMSGSTITVDAADAGQTVGTATAGATGALVLGMSGTNIDSVALTNVILGDAAGPSIGDFALVGVHVAGSNILISSH